MHVGDGPDPPPITAGTIAVKFVNSFNDLWSTVMNTGNLHEEINQCQSLAASHNSISLEATWEAYMYMPVHQTAFLQCLSDTPPSLQI